MIFRLRVPGTNAKSRRATSVDPAQLFRELERSFRMRKAYETVVSVVKLMNATPAADWPVFAVVCLFLHLQVEQARLAGLDELRWRSLRNDANTVEKVRELVDKYGLATAADVVKVLHSPKLSWVSGDYLKFALSPTTASRFVEPLLIQMKSKRRRGEQSEWAVRGSAGFKEIEL